MHVAQINFFVDPRKRGPEELLQAWPTLVDVAEAPIGAGVRVSVIQAAHSDDHLRANGVDYHFVNTEPGRRDIVGVTALAARLSSLQVDVLHMHGLTFARQAGSLAALCPAQPVLLQDHADRVPRWWRRRSWRSGLKRVAGVAFCSEAQAVPFRQAGLLSAGTSVFAIPEATSRFVPRDQQMARSATGLYGDPCVLWIGHLDANKDPLTVLAGISQAAREFPGLQLWCCFGKAPLATAVRARIAGDPQLATRVHLLGTVPHAQIELLLSAADLFVSGSHREGSGFSLIEALACGVSPVVTDIPSFRALTGQGAIGALWNCGDAAGLCNALIRQWRLRQRGLRNAVREHFERNLSMQAIGQQLARTYATLAMTRGARTR